MFTGDCPAVREVRLSSLSFHGADPDRLLSVVEQCFAVLPGLHLDVRRSGNTTVDLNPEKWFLKGESTQRWPSLFAPTSALAVPLGDKARERAAEVLTYSALSFTLSLLSYR